MGKLERLIDAINLKKQVKAEAKSNLNEELQANFVDIAHDNASCLSSHKNGLYGLIKKEKTDYFFYLPDPCHGQI